MANMSRASGYVRVSRVLGREGEQFISPEVQREQIATWAKLRGVEIVAWYEDLDVSGGTRERPGLAAFLTALRDGETDGIIVSRLDRLSRLGVTDALALVEEIHEHGGTISAIDLGIDPTTVFGEFAMTIMLGLSRMERRRLTESWDIAKTRAMARGAKVGPTPLGYRRNENGTLAIHEGEAAVVRRAFELAAQHDHGAALETLQRAALKHEGKGKRAGQLRSWTPTTVRRLLAQRIYLGEMRHEGFAPYDDENLRLVDRATFEAAQRDTATRRTNTAAPLSGIARCGTCGEGMVGGRGGKNDRTYRCRASLASFKGPKCPAPATTLAEPLEAIVRETLRGAIGDLEFGAADPVGLDDLEAAMLGSERELDDFLADTEGAAALRRVGRYAEGLTARTDAVERDRAAYRDAASAAGDTLSASPDELLAEDNPAGLAELAGAAITVTVARGRGPIIDRLTITASDTPVPAVLAA